MAQRVLGEKGVREGWSGVILISLALGHRLAHQSYSSTRRLLDTLLNLCGRLGMVLALDLLWLVNRTADLRLGSVLPGGTWRYLGVPSSAYCCLGVAAGTLSYLTLTPRLPSVAYRSDDCNESGAGHSLQYKNVYVAPSR